MKLTKNRQKFIENIAIYNVGYITIKKIDNYENIHSVNPLYLMLGHIEENNGNKYAIFDSVDGNKKVVNKIHRSLGWD